MIDHAFVDEVIDTDPYISSYDTGYMNVSTIDFYSILENE